MSDKIVIRRATLGDADGIAQIYNYAVLHLAATAQETVQTVEERTAWLAEHAAQNLPVYVAALGDTVVGWSSLSKFHSRSAYRFTVEDSVYVHPDWCGQGLGKRLLRPLVQEAADRGFHAIMAWVDSENRASIALHTGFGFEEVGHFREVMRKFDRWLDVVVLEMRFSGKHSAA